MTLCDWLPLHPIQPSRQLADCKSSVLSADIALDGPSQQDWCPPFLLHAFLSIARREAECAQDDVPSLVDHTLKVEGEDTDI